MKYVFSAAALVLFSTSTVAAPVAPGNMPAYCRGEASVRDRLALIFVVGT